MSVITDMLLLTSAETDSAPIKKLNAWCRDDVVSLEDSCARPTARL
jgi:hypothetical protein